MIIQSFIVKRKITIVEEEAHVVFIEWPEPHNHDGPHAMTDWYDYNDCGCEVYRECVVTYCRYYELEEKENVELR
jgi:hypothetical protein